MGIGTFGSDSDNLIRDTHTHANIQFAHIHIITVLTTPQHTCDRDVVGSCAVRTLCLNDGHLGGNLLLVRVVPVGGRNLDGYGRATV